MFLRIKKFLIKNRILEYTNKNMDTLMTRLENMPYKMPHMTENWT